MRAPLFRVTVAGLSMVPVLAPGDVCVVRRTSRIAVGDVVVAERPDRPGLLIVKRAVRRDPEGWWLSGDNAYASDDSAVFGAVPDASVVGRVVWPRRAARR